MTEGGEISVEQVQFFGLQVPSRKPVRQEVVYSDHEFEVIHVTNVALGENPTDGPHVVKMVHGGKEYVLGTLQKGLVYQFPTDFGITDDVDFINTGHSPVFLSGYRTMSAIEQTYEMESDEEEDEEEEESEESEDEDEAVPQAVPLGLMAGANGVPQRKAAKASEAKTKAELGKAKAKAKHEPLVPGDEPKRRANAAAVRKKERAARHKLKGVQPLIPAADQEADEDEEEDEDYDEDEDEDEDEQMELDAEDVEEMREARKRLAGLIRGEGNAFPADEFDEDDEDEDEDEDEEGEEDEDEEGGMMPRLGSDDIIGVFPGGEDEEDEDEDEEDEDEEEEEEEAPRPAPEPFAAPARTPAHGAAKRPPTTPQPQQQKKQKTGEQRVPASAPPKVQAGKVPVTAKPDKGSAAKADKGGKAAAGGADKDYEAALMSHLRTEGGAVPLAVLGSKVKRPEGVSMKLKAFITTHTAHFKYDDKSQLVSLA